MIEILIKWIPVLLFLGIGAYILIDSHRRARKRKDIILMEKALGIYPKVICPWCHEEVYIDQVRLDMYCCKPCHLNAIGKSK
jgi:hypothetical protein